MRFISAGVPAWAVKAPGAPTRPCGPCRAWCRRRSSSRGRAFVGRGECGLNEGLGAPARRARTPTRFGPVVPAEPCGEAGA